MKKILKIFVLCICLLVGFFFAQPVGAADVIDIDTLESSAGQFDNISIGGGAKGANEARSRNEKLTNFNDENFIGDDGIGGEAGVYNFLLRLARDLKNFLFVIASIFFLIIVIQLILSDNTEEAVWKFKKWIIWITVGIIIMQLAYSFTIILFDQWVSQQLAVNFMQNLVTPLILLIQTLASIFFVAMAILAFYRLATANGNEEAIKNGRMTIVYAIIGFLVLRFARLIVEAFYGKINCDSFSNWLIKWRNISECIRPADLSSWVNIIITIINWMNGFVALVVVLMIIYAGVQIMLSGGDEERVKKWRQSIVYIAIGLAILVLNFLILTFFLRPEAVI